MLYFFLDFRMVEEEQEGPHQARGGGLHAGDEQVNQVVEQSVVTYFGRTVFISAR